MWVIFGKNTSTFTTIDLLFANFGNNGIYYTGALAEDNLGSSVAPAGDFNGDGIADFLIGAAGTDRAPGSDDGAAYLIYGSKTALITMDMSTFSTNSAGVRFLGADTTDRLGLGLSGVGDVNDDGFDDIALGAPYATPPTPPIRISGGMVFVIYGNDGTYGPTGVNLRDFLDFSKGFQIYGSGVLGYPSPAGDVNGDGVNDILVNGVSTTATSHIIYGQKTIRTTHVDTRSDSVMTFAHSGNSFLGSGADGGKDVNGDGIPDILLGAWFVSNLRGSAWMLPGPFALPTDAPTTAPTIVPTIVPTSAPSMDPSALPSVNPTLYPTTAPSPVFTAVPSVVPSARPTDTVFLNFVVTSNVQQVSSIQHAFINSIVN